VGNCEVEEEEDDLDIKEEVLEALEDWTEFLERIGGRCERSAGPFLSKSTFRKKNIIQLKFKF
jgi:hypothetical protein